MAALSGAQRPSRIEPSVLGVDREGWGGASLPGEGGEKGEKNEMAGGGGGGGGGGTNETLKGQAHFSRGLWLEAHCRGVRHSMGWGGGVAQAKREYRSGRLRFTRKRERGLRGENTEEPRPKERGKRVQPNTR